MNRSGAGDSQGEHGANHGWHDHRAEGLVIVDVRLLDEVAKDPASLVSLQRAIRVELVLENPFVDDDIGANRVRDKIPGVIDDQGSKLFFHGIVPILVDEGGTDGGGHRRQGQHRSDREGESVGQKLEAPLRPCGHWMRVDRRSHRYDLCRR
jgi:hypothetical protein